MAILRVSGVRLSGICSSVPSETQTIKDIAQKFGQDDAEKIAASIGVEQRKVAPKDMCASDLCFAAAEELLSTLGWGRESVKGLVFVSQTPDYFAPATSCVLHDRLGLPTDCIAFDMNLGCSGYVYGLASASQLAAGIGGRVLLLVGDTITKMVSEDDRSMLPLFGDAGSATALEADPSAAEMTFCLGTDGSGKNDLIVREGAFRCPPGQDASADPRQKYVYMDGAEVFRFAISEVPKLYRQTLAQAGWESEDVEAVVMHQSNQFMLEHLRKRLKIPTDSFIVALKNYGNTSCASIPLAFSDHWGGDNQTVTKKMVLVGFGVGWSWGGVTLQCDNAAAPKVIEAPNKAEQSSCAA